MASMAEIHYTFKGQKHTAKVHSTATTQDLLEAIAQETSVPVAGLKVSYKGKALKSEHSSNTEESERLLVKYPGIDSPSVKLFVVGTTEHDIAKVHTIDNHVETRKKYRPAPTVKKSQPQRSIEDDKYTFGGIQVLPQFSQQDKARAVLERLKEDKGIRGIMKLHKWQVGSLIELSPAEKTILGYNRNKGELIALRLRTDDLEGFRHYDAVRKVLLHELAHNVWSEHDDNFHALNRQLNKEVQQLDWTAQGGHRVSQGEYYNPENGEISGYVDDLLESGTSWQGGTYTLGGGKGSSRDPASHTLSTRELVARAAQLRQIESEKDEDGMCGAK
ncbi:hypothetical protein BGZ94_008251 [Podila epigama]|nr:hypothetical protein BGZ94_008251 [Podila epigama]